MQTQMQFNGNLNPKRPILQEIFFQFEPLLIMFPLGLGVLLSFALIRIASQSILWVHLPSELDLGLVLALIVRMHPRAWKIYLRDKARKDQRFINIMVDVSRCGMLWPTELKHFLHPAISGLKRLIKNKK